MSDIQLFRLGRDGSAQELSGRAADIERDLQTLIERKMEVFLGVRFLASEYATGKTHRGRIDSLGLDENGCPVIVEYKRHSNENVINQGLFYLDWLLDHRAEFSWLVLNQLGKEQADSIDWKGTRLLCIAADFTRYDQHAVQQIPRNIELLRYKLFADDLLLFELVNSVSVADVTASKPAVSPLQPPTVAEEAAAKRVVGKDKTFDQQYAGALPETRAIYDTLASYAMGLGDDVSERRLKLYVAFRRLKNFASVVMYPNKMLVMLKLNPDAVALEEGFSRDVRQIGHWGAGDLELTVRTMADFQKAQPLIERSYQEG
jgi:predicted transport protein